MTTMKSLRSNPRLPTKEELLAFIQERPGRVAKREIAKAFNLKGGARIELKRMLGELAEEGKIERGGRRFHQHNPKHLPPVTLLEVIGPDDDGDLLARPVSWEGEGAPPSVVLAPPRKNDPALGARDRFLGKLSPLNDGPYAYEARIIKKITAGRQVALGVFVGSDSGGRIQLVDKRGADELRVAAEDVGEARNGELVEAEILPSRGYGLKRARIVGRLGAADAPQAISTIAIHEQGIPVDFPPAAIEEAQRAEAEVSLGRRLDLRQTPLVTIDPADAKDHDDAVFAELDSDPANAGGWIVWVAIADVAYYVPPGSALDEAARDRGNSAYFPDRVVPMLPDRLSGDLCSLHEGVDRACFAVRMVLGENGVKRSHSFHRALMRSAASLTYDQAQEAWEGEADEQAAPLLDHVIAPLFGAYHAALKAREKRCPLDLDLPERKVELADTGAVASINFRERFEAHQLIEEFMILANVCAAETLEAKRAQGLYRVHEEPSPEKIESLREILSSIEIPLAKGQVTTPRLLNQALDQAGQSEHMELVNMAVLRAQTQAYYSPENFGHFGLALPRYAHFTSPIRRYADLVTHRALIGALGLGDDGQTEEERAELPETARHISMTERRAMAAERDTVDRYLAAYLAEKEGARFEGRITGVQRFGVFVQLHESGADGLVPIGSLGDEYFRFDEGGARLVGERSGVELRMGQEVAVRLLEATPVTGGLIFELLDLPRGRRGAGRSSRRLTGARAGNPVEKSRKASRAKIAKAKSARKARLAKGARKRR